MKVGDLVRISPGHESPGGEYVNHRRWKFFKIPSGSVGVIVYVQNGYATVAYECGLVDFECEMLEVV